MKKNSGIMSIVFVGVTISDAAIGCFVARGGGQDEAESFNAPGRTSGSVYLCSGRHVDGHVYTALEAQRRR